MKEFVKFNEDERLEIFLLFYITMRRVSQRGVDVVSAIVSADEASN
jgi:hypothetical protein